MKILISNDDGILSPALAALYRAVSDLGDITVVAPDSPQSASAHAITLRRALTVREVQLEDFTGMSVDGRPADCVRLAIRALMEEPPDLVLSGINEGQNVGINVFYSGTVAAAAEAVMLGVPAVAFSASMLNTKVDFQRIGSLCRQVLDRLLVGGIGKSDLINVNLPLLDSPELPKGVKVVGQSTAEMIDAYTRESDGETSTYRIGDDYSYGEDHEPHTDVACVLDGYISVTPLHLDMTNHQRIEPLSAMDWNDIR